MDLKDLKINFLGDSITEGHGVADKNNVYWKRLESCEGLAIARGYGISGTRYAKKAVPSLNPSHDQDFCGRYATMDDDADVVVVFGGTNDYGHGDAPLGSPDDRDPYTFYGACHTLYQGLIEKYPASTIVIMTPLHRLIEDAVSDDLGKKHPLSAYVAIEKEVAAYYSLPVLDLWATSGLQPHVPIIKERYMPDGLHPNDAGQELIYKRLAGFLKSL